MAKSKLPARQDQRDSYIESIRSGTLPSDALGMVGLLAEVPEEEVWLGGLRSERTRRAYRVDVGDFVATLGIRSRDELHQLRPAALIHWQRILEGKGLKPRTIRRKLSAVSSLFGHLVRRQVIENNPAREVTRPRVNRRRGTTSAFGRKEARAILDAPDPETLAGLRDKAILAVGLQVGLRRNEIARLIVKDWHVNLGIHSLR